MSTMESLGKSLDEAAVMLDARLERDAATITRLTEERDELLAACRDAARRLRQTVALADIEAGTMGCAPSDLISVAETLEAIAAKATGDEPAAP